MRSRRSEIGSYNDRIALKFDRHHDVIKWKPFPRYWSFVRGIHWSPVNSSHKGQWRGALMFCLICVWINDWVNNCDAGDLRRHRGHYYVIVMHLGNAAAGVPVKFYSDLQSLRDFTRSCGKTSVRPLSEQKARIRHDDVIKWIHFPRYWPFVRGIHRSPVNSLRKGQWRGALMFSLIYWINGWVNSREAGDRRRYRAHSDVTVMSQNEIVL